MYLLLLLLERVAGRNVLCCVRMPEAEGLVWDGMLILQLSLFSTVPHVLCTSIIASCLLYGNRDPNSGGYTAAEENSGDRDHAGA